MKNLKRILSLVLAVLMLLSVSTISFAAGFDDVPDSYKYAEAINLLSGLGIITGYGNGDFKPEGTITRAEAATIIVRTLGLDEDIDRGDTIFSDVDSDHWASGYINVAVENGIINGFPEGTFLPEDDVTYEQIVKMVVCAIGHEPKAKELGTYPQGYIRAASDAKVTKGIAGLGSKSAPRGLVAQLIYNALEVEMMDATTFSTGILGTSYSYNGKTLLRDYLEIEKVNAVVTDTYLTDGTFSQKDKFIKLEIKSVHSIKDRASIALYDVGDVINFDEGDTDDATSFLGKAVVAYVGEDSKTGENTIFAIASDDFKNDVVEVTKNKFYKKDSTASLISYSKRATDKKLTELELDKKVTVVVNGEIVTKPITDYFDDFDIMTLIDNDRDSEYDFIFVDMFDKTEGVEFVVVEKEADDSVYYFEGKTGELELDYDDDVIITIIKDGREIDVEDIEIGDTVTCLDTSLGVVTVYVSDNIVRGTIEEVDYDEGEYYINDEVYTLSPAFAETLSAGDYGTFYLNYKGKIAYSTVSSRISTGDYLFVTNYKIDYDFSDMIYVLQAVNADGEVESYTLKSSRMKYVDANGNMFTDVSAKTVYDYLTANKSDLSTAYNINGYVGLIRVKVSAAGIISEVYMPGTYQEFYTQTKYAKKNDKEYNAKREAYGVFDIDPDAVAFRVDDSETSLTDAVAAGTIGEFFADGNNYTFLAYGERDEDIEAFVITDGISTTDYQSRALIVTKTSSVNAKGYVTTKIVGLQNGREVTYIVDPDERFNVSVGNIILVSENAEGYVDKLVTVANTTDDIKDLYTAFDNVNIPSDQDAGVYGGMVDGKTNKRFTIKGIEDPFYDEENTSFILIDYTGRETTFEKGSLSDIRVSVTTDSFVVVRTYEDEAIDVFIFRANSGTINVNTTNIWDKVVPVEPENPATEPTDDATEGTDPATEPTDDATEGTDSATEPTGDATEGTEPVTEPTGDATEGTEPVTEPTGDATEGTDPVTEPTGDATEGTEPVTEPTGDATEGTDPVTEPTGDATEGTEPVTEPTGDATEGTDPVTEPTGDATEGTDPVTEPTGDATEGTDPVTEPTGDATEGTDPVTEPTGDATEATGAPEQDGPVLAEIPTEKPVEKKVTVDAKLAAEVLKLINAERTKASLTPFALDASVAKVAEKHCIDMATKGYLDQKGKDGSTVQTRLTAEKVQYTLAAENLAKGKYSAAVIVDAWMKSAAHNVNILSKDFTKVGISVATAIDGTIYWTVDFIK